MMARIRKSMEEKDQGFTLIELLVVMIIIGILAAIAVPVFLSQRSKARLTSAKSDGSVISKEMAAYYVDGNSALTLSGSAAAWTLSTSTTPGGTAGTQVSTGKLSPNNVAVGAGNAQGQYCVVVSTGTTGDGYVTVTQNGLTTTPSGTAPTSCTPAA